jgi:membrane protease YdiL (CAAX protease family)
MTENYHYPNISQSIWILILLIILQGVLSIPLVILENVTDFPLSDHPAVLALTSVIIFGLILMRGLKRSQISVREICPLVPVRLSLLFPMALTVIGTSILISEADNLLRTFLPAPAWFSDYLKSLVGGQISLWGSIVGLVIVAPLTEELLVRGLILRGFLSHYSKRKAILASAIFFGVLHLNPWQFIGATVLGVLFAWWFIQTRSMFPCLFGHALANALPLAVTAIFRLEVPGFTIDFEKAEFQPLWLDCLGVVLVALGIWLLIHQFRKSSDTVPEDMSGDGSDQL